MSKIFGLAEYGTREIIVSFIICAAVVLLFCKLNVIWLSLIPAILFIWVLYFFRDPVREIPKDTNAIVSPADGKITHIMEVDEPDFIGGKAKMIGIFLSVFDVHLNRIPFKGTVKFIKYKEGKFLDARAEDCSAENEANSIGIETDHPKANKIMIKQIAGLIARRIVCDCKEGDQLNAGDVVGMIKFGSRTEIYLPAGAEFDIKVNVGDKVAAGSTILGELK
jgi:phosphatidylserine decarboxylase